MRYKSSFNELIMPCNAPYNAMYDIMNNYLRQNMMYCNAYYEWL